MENKKFIIRRSNPQGKATDCIAIDVANRGEFFDGTLIFEARYKDDLIKELADFNYESNTEAKK